MGVALRVGQFRFERLNELGAGGFGGVGVDLVEAMSVKIALNAQHYPVSESKGRHSRPGMWAGDRLSARFALVAW